MRDSVNELGADIQRKIINKAAEARERGTMLDKSAVKTVFEDFEDRITGTTESDLPTLEVEEMAESAIPEPPTVDGEMVGPQEAPADD